MPLEAFCLRIELLFGIFGAGEGPGREAFDRRLDRFPLPFDSSVEGVLFPLAGLPGKDDEPAVRNVGVGRSNLPDRVFLSGADRFGRLPNKRFGLRNSLWDPGDPSNTFKGFDVLRTVEGTVDDKGGGGLPRAGR